MFIEINTSDSTTQELSAMARFFADLAGTKVQESAQQTVAANVEPAEAVVAGEVQQDTAPVVTRRRRTKAEIEAAAQAEIEAANAARSQVEVAKDAPVAENTVVEETVVDAAETTVVEEPKDDFEAAAVTEGKTYSEAEVQQLATVVARSKGPQFVKDKITELGAPRIAALTPEQLNVMGAYLEANK